MEYYSLNDELIIKDVQEFDDRINDFIQNKFGFRPIVGSEGIQEENSVIVDYHHLPKNIDIKELSNFILREFDLKSEIQINGDKMIIELSKSYEEDDEEFEKDFDEN